MFFNMNSCKADCRSCILSFRLKEQSKPVIPEYRNELPFYIISIFLTCNHTNIFCRYSLVKPHYRLLDHCGISKYTEKLLRSRLSAYRPEPRPAPPCKNYRINIIYHFLVLKGRCADKSFSSNTLLSFGLASQPLFKMHPSFIPPYQGGTQGGCHVYHNKILLL